MKQSLLLILIIPALVQAQSYKTTLDENIKAIMPKVVEWRRQFHQYPELSNREYKTGAFVADYLRSLGLEVKYPVAKTGVVAILKGAREGPVIALRADMDALPITESVDLPFRSVTTDTFSNQTVGVMHACGHDAHVAILMGAAAVLSKMKKDIPGTIVFLFQPAEEGVPEGEEAGAPYMIKEGVLDNPKVEAVFGFHIQSWLEAGSIQYKPGAFMASSDWFTVTVNGKGSHGSQPWMGVDPIVISAQIIQALQTIISRQIDIAKAPVVISVGSINSGNRANIIPGQCVFTGTIRTLDGKTRKDVFDRINRTAENIAAGAGGDATVSFYQRTVVMYNDSSLVNRTLPALQAATGSANVVLSGWSTYSEDFSFYGEKVPAFFFYLGGMPKGSDPATAPAHHTPDFFIDETGFDVGVKAFCEIALNYVGGKK